MPKTATEIALDEQIERTGLNQLVEMKQRFIKHWKPEGEHYIEEFIRDLDYLLHLAAREAVAPIVKHFTGQISALVMRQPISFDPEVPKK